MKSESYFNLLNSILEILENYNQIRAWEDMAKELSDNALLSLHGSIIDALNADDKPDAGNPYNVRGTADWKEWANALELEMKNRDLKFLKVPWSSACSNSA